MLAPSTPGGVKTVFAQAATRVFIDPPTQTVGDVGDFFIVNVDVADVSNLYAFEFKLYYDSTVMNGTQASQGSFLKGGVTVFFSFIDEYNSTYGFLNIAVTLFGSVPGVSGSGVLATIKFKSLAPAESVPLHLADVKLSDPNINPITTDTTDGAVTVAAVDWWPMFHRELTHTGYSTSPTPSTNQTLWNFTTGGSVLSSPTVGGGIVYVGSDNKVYALNASTGVLVWSHTIGSYVESSPAVAGGMVFVGSDDGNVTALNATDGAFKWNYTTNGVVFSSPAVAGGRVFVGSEDGKVYALNETTGAQIWNYSAGSQVASSPAVAGGMVFVGSDDGNVTALDAFTGVFVWNYTIGSYVESSPAVAGGMVFVGSGGGNVTALDAANGSFKWNYTTNGPVFSSPAVVDGRVFVGSEDGKVYALDETTGAQIWNYTTDNLVDSSPAVAGGKVFVGSYDGNVYALNASTGTRVWSYSIDGSIVFSSPAVAGGKVFVSSTDGNVSAFGLSVSISPSYVLMDVGQSLTFTSSVTGGTPPYVYQWYLNSTVVSGATSSSWAFIPASSGFCTVYVNVTDNVGVSAKSNIASVTVYGALSVTIFPTNVAMDIGQSLTFTSSVSGGLSPYTYQWCLNGANVPSATSSTWTFTPDGIVYASGFYSVYLNVTDNNGLRAESNTASVTVNPALSVRAFPANVTMGVGQSQLFASSVSGGTFPYFYRWYLNGVAVTGATSAKWTFTPSFAGFYTVMVKVNDAVGAQKASDQSNVTVVVVDWWPMFHHDLTHTGNSTSTAPNSNQTLWSYTTGSAVYSSPAVVGGIVYVGADKVYALNASTGALVWAYMTGSYSRSSPTVVGGIVYVGADKVYALNASTGALVWSYTTGGQVYSSPALADGRVYVGSGDGNVYALDASTGALVWNYTTGAPVVSSPAVAGGVVFVGSEDNKVYALNEMSGARIWSYNFGYLVDSSPAVAGGVVFVGSYDGNVYALNATTGALMRSYLTGSASAVFSSPAIAGGVVYVGSEDGNVYAWNATTGEMIWTNTTGSYVFSSPAVAGGMIFVGSYDYNVYALNATDGHLVWSYTTGSWVVSSPAVVGGVVFVGSYDGNVYAFGIVPLSVSISPSSAMMDVGQSQLFTSNVTGGISPYLYQWYLNDTAVSGATGATWAFTPGSSGSYSVYLSVTDNVGLRTESNIVSVTVSGAPSVIVSPTSVTVDVGQPQNFTSTVSDGTPPYTYQWYLSGAAVSGATSSLWTFTPSSSGSYTVYVNATDSVGVRAKSNVASITVIPAVSVIVSPTSVTMAVGQSQTFTSSVSGGAPSYSYQWYRSGLPELGATAATWIFTPLSAGFYTVYLKVADSLGGQATSNTATANVTAVAVDWWPMFHHDLTHTGYSTSTVQNTYQTLWSYTTGSGVYSSPAVVDGRVYVGSDNVYALNASTGVRIWNYATGSYVRSSPAVSGGIVYVGSDRVYALDASTGTSVWTYTTGGPVYSSPAVADGRVFVGSYDSKVYALNAATGAVLWSTPTSGQVYSSPAVAGGMVFVGSGDDRVYALNAATGAVLWSRPTGSAVYSSPAVAGGRVYVGSYDGNVSALDASMGASIWNYTTGDAVDSSPAVAGGVVFVGSGNRVYGLSASTGAFVWSYTTGADVDSSPAIFGGVVFVASEDSKVYAFGQLPLSASILPSVVVLDVGQSRLFTSSATGGTSPYSYRWYVNGTAVSGATNPTWTFTPTSAASYSVYLKVTDSASAIATSNTVQVTANGPLSITIAPSSSTIGTAQSQLFTSTISGGTSPFAYQWYLNGTAVPSATSSTWTFSPSSTGSYSIYANVTDNAGFRAKSNIATVTVTSVSVTISPTSVTMNVGQSQLFTSSVSGGSSPYSYRWYLNGTQVSGATSSSWTFTPSSAGSYTVYVKVTDSVLVQATSNTATATVTAGGGPYTLTMYTVGQGSVLPGNGTYASGASVDIKAIAASGWVFAGWSGNVTGSTNMTIVMSGKMFETATFTQGTFSLTMYTVGQGSVQPGNGTYLGGTSVNITAITVTGWAFQGWSGNAFGLSNTTIVMNGNMFVTATFSQVVAGHDVAVTNIASDKTSIGQGFFSNVTVTIGNLGSFAETFNVTVYANQTATNQTVIATFVNTALASGSFTTLNFTWTTSGFAKSNYTIIAYAGPVPGDVNTTNNYLSSGPVAVTIIGDLNGDFKVSLADLVILANAYGARLGDARWNPNSDIDCNRVVSLTDLVNLAINYQGHFP
jgi:outer membrane protein assembly factor BamB